MQKRGHLDRENAYMVLIAHWRWPNMYSLSGGLKSEVIVVRPIQVFRRSRLGLGRRFHSNPFQALEIVFLQCPTYEVAISHLLVLFFWFRRWARAAPTTDEKEEAESMSLVNEVCAPFQVWQQVMRSEGASAFSAQEV